MIDDINDNQHNKGEITLGCDLATFSLEDIDERVDLLVAEIERLKEERVRKSWQP